jgi:hypothetical protein
MKAKSAVAFALGLIMFMQTSTLIASQRITSFTTLAKGQGTLTYDDEKRKISGVWVNLKEDGEAEITLYTELQLFVKGQWSASDNRTKGISLKITGGIVDGSTTGAGTLFFCGQMGNQSISSVFRPSLQSVR